MDIHPLLVRLVGVLILLSIPYKAIGDEHQVGVIETILELIDDESEKEIIADRLERLLLSPLDINKATREELAQLPFMDDFAIRNLLLYRSQHSGFDSIYELKVVQGMPEEMLPLLEPFITTGPSPYVSFHSDAVRQNIMVGTSLLFMGESKKEDFPLTPSLLLKYEGSKEKWGWHLTMENDKGESYLPLVKGLSDFSSGGLYYQADSLSFIFGDFRLTTGQGLLMGQSLSYFSSLQYSGSISTLSTSRLAPHRSFREIGFLRGVAGKITTQHLTLLGYLAYEPQDARIEGQRILTLYRNGLHRTENEKTFRHTSRLETLGGYFSYDPSAKFHAGLSGMTYRFKRSNGGKKLYPPTSYGKNPKSFLSAVDFLYLGRHWKAFGESTLRPLNAIATQGGMAYFSDEFGTLTIQGRYLGKDNYTPYGKPDGYTSTGRNEMGIRALWVGELARWVTGTFYFDRFRAIGGKDPASHVFSARVAYALGQSYLITDIRYLKLQNNDKRRSITLSGQHPLSQRWCMRGNIKLMSSRYEPVSYSINGRIQYRSNALNSDLSVQYFKLNNNRILSGYLPYMPYMFGGQTLRGTGYFLSASMRFAVTDNLKINLRASKTIYTSNQYPSSTMVDLSTTLRL